MFTLRFPVSPKGHNIVNAIALRRFSTSLAKLATSNPWAAYDICRAYALAQIEKGPPHVLFNGQEIASAEMDGELATRGLARHLAEQTIPLPNTTDVEVVITDLSSGNVILSFGAAPA